MALTTDTIVAEPFTGQGEDGAGRRGLARLGVTVLRLCFAFS